MSVIQRRQIVRRTSLYTVRGGIRRYILGELRVRESQTEICLKVLGGGRQCAGCEQSCGERKIGFHRSNSKNCSPLFEGGCRAIESLVEFASVVDDFTINDGEQALGFLQLLSRSLQKVLRKNRDIRQHTRLDLALFTLFHLSKRSD